MMSTIEYTFEWPAGPQDVIVTGEFDDWKGTLPLVKSSTGAFELTFPVKIPEDKDKVFFKFIVDGNWVTSDAYNKGYDEQTGIENNYISKTEAKALSENPAEAKIPEAGGLPFVTAAANGAIQTEEVKTPQQPKDVIKTEEPVEPTPVRSSNVPTPGATAQLPIKTGEAKVTPNLNKPNVTSEPKVIAEHEPESEQIRFKIVRRVRKNNKTGEITILSEEKIPLGPEETSPEGVVIHEEASEHTEPDIHDAGRNTNSLGSNVTAPDPKTLTSEAVLAAVDPQQARNLESSGNENRDAFHTLPVGDPIQPGQSTQNPILGGPGPMIPNNANEIKEFKEVRDVDAKALNERLNAEVERTAVGSTTLDPKTHATNVNGNSSDIEPKSASNPDKDVLEKKKQAAPEAAKAPALTPAPATATPTKTTKKPVANTASTAKAEEKKKKTGFFSKLKKIFD